MSQVTLQFPLSIFWLFDSRTFWSASLPSLLYRIHIQASFCTLILHVHFSKVFCPKWKWSDINVQLIWFSIYILRPKKRNVISCLFTVIGPLGGKLVANTKYKWIILAFLSAPSTPENKLKIENWKQSKNFRMKIITFRMTGLWKCGIWKKEFKLQQNLNFCLHKHKTHIICYHQGYI